MKKEFEDAEETGRVEIEEEAGKFETVLEVFEATEGKFKKQLDKFDGEFSEI